QKRPAGDEVSVLRRPPPGAEHDGEDAHGGASDRKQEEPQSSDRRARRFGRLACKRHGSTAGIAATPGSSFPSRSSSAAPPPVETHETRSVRPNSASARAESAPPTTEYPSACATASATAFVPSAKRGHSNTPIGPFQKIVRAPAIRSAKASRVAGPMSSPSQPSGSASYGTTRASASASNAAAATTSEGSSTS